jgi:hypothetical protein
VPTVACSTSKQFTIHIHKRGMTRKKNKGRRLKARIRKKKGKKRRRNGRITNGVQREKYEGERRRQ